MSLDAVERQVSADGEAESLNVVDRVPLVAHVPSLDERFLHNILSLGVAQGDAQRQAVELVLQR